MSTHVRSQDAKSVSALEESYWAALLKEGEYSQISSMGNTPEYDISEVKNTEITTEETVIDDTTSDWQTITHIMENDEVLELPVVGFNRGGLLVEWRSLRGFVPASQLVSFPQEAGTAEVRRNSLSERVGDVLNLRIIELNAEKNRLIFSERAAQVKSGTREELLRRLQPGDKTDGIITNLCDFGAFVDLGGVEGLIHISELSWGRVGHPSDILQRGQQLRVYVLEVDHNSSRIALSLKRLHPDPWATVGHRYQIGQIVEGRITNVVDFGAFACIEEGLEGLIHFSELAEGHFLHPRNVVEEGDIVRARILSIDGRNRRLGLSLRLT